MELQDNAQLDASQVSDRRGMGAGRGVALGGGDLTGGGSTPCLSGHRPDDDGIANSVQAYCKSAQIGRPPGCNTFTGRI